MGATVMFKAILLLIGVGLYLSFLQLGREVAMTQLGRVENLYTAASAQSDTMSSSVNPENNIIVGSAVVSPK